MATIDASSSGSWSSGLTTTVSHTCAASAMLQVYVGYSLVAFTSIQGVTYNGSACSFMDRQDFSTNYRIELWKHESPASGANNIVVTVNDNTSLALKVIGVSATGAGSIATAIKATGTSTTPAVTISSLGASDIPVAGCLAVDDLTAGDTQVLEVSNANHTLNVARQAAGGDGVMNWTIGSSQSWACIGARFVDSGVGASGHPTMRRWGGVPYVGGQGVNDSGSGGGKMWGRSTIGLWVPERMAA